MSDDNLVSKMFEIMRRDFEEGGKIHFRYVDLPYYQKKFGISDQQVADYCASLPMLVPQHPTCILCGREWQSLEKVIKPIGAGHCIDWYDSFEMWCAGSEEKPHDTIWYYQNRDGHASLDMEVDNLDGKDYSVRWNCSCAVSECQGKNVIYNTSYDEPTFRYGPFTTEQMPHHITHPQLLQLINSHTPVRV